MAAKPVVILVHGAWHRPSHWENVRSKLEADGYTVDTPALVSAATEAVDEPLEKDIAIVKKTILQYTAANQHVVLVVHSYGGIVGSEAVGELYEESTLPGTHGRLLHQFYVNSHILEPGTSMSMDVDTKHIMDVEDNLVYHLEPYHRFYNECTPNVARKAMSQLLPQALHTILTKVKYRGYADYGVPTTYLACKNDTALAYDPDLLRFQKRLESSGVKDLIIKTLDCDHTPWLSAEGDFFKILQEVLDKATKDAGR